MSSNRTDALRGGDTVSWATGAEGVYTIELVLNREPVPPEAADLTAVLDATEELVLCGGVDSPMRLLTAPGLHRVEVCAIGAFNRHYKVTVSPAVERGPGSVGTVELPIDPQPRRSKVQEVAPGLYRLAVRQMDRHLVIYPKGARRLQSGTYPRSPPKQVLWVAYPVPDDGVVEVQVHLPDQEVPYLDQVLRQGVEVSGSMRLNTCDRHASDAAVLELPPGEWGVKVGVNQRADRPRYHVVLNRQRPRYVMDYGLLSWKAPPGR